MTSWWETEAFSQIFVSGATRGYSERITDPSAACFCCPHESKNALIAGLNYRLHYLNPHHALWHCYPLVLCVHFFLFSFRLYLRVLDSTVHLTSNSSTQAHLLQHKQLSSQEHRSHLKCSVLFMHALTASGNIHIFWWVCGKPVLPQWGLAWSLIWDSTET